MCVEIKVGGSLRFPEWALQVSDPPACAAWSTYKEWGPLLRILNQYSATTALTYVQQYKIAGRLKGQSQAKIIKNR